MAILTALLQVLLVLSSLFLIFLILIQRGKGGGLAGAFGGVGGSSAFGTQAGDVFTKITMYTAIVWFVLNILLVVRQNQNRVSAFVDPDKVNAKGKKVPGKPKSTDKGTTTTKPINEIPAQETPIPVPPTDSGSKLPSPLSDTPDEMPDKPFAEPK